jgi:hypothetical protein
MGKVNRRLFIAVILCDAASRQVVERAEEFCTNLKLYVITEIR